MDDAAEFLRRHAPFDTLDEESLAAVAASVEASSFAPGAAILDSAENSSEHAFVVRRGSVERRRTSMPSPRRRTSCPERSSRSTTPASRPPRSAARSRRCTTRSRGG